MMRKDIDKELKKKLKRGKITIEYALDYSAQMIAACSLGFKELTNKIRMDVLKYNGNIPGILDCLNDILEKGDDYPERGIDILYLQTMEPEGWGIIELAYSTRSIIFRRSMEYLKNAREMAASKGMEYTLETFLEYCKKESVREYVHQDALMKGLKKGFQEIPNEYFLKNYFRDIEAGIKLEDAGKPIFDKIGNLINADGILRESNCAAGWYTVDYMGVIDFEAPVACRMFKPGPVGSRTVVEVAPKNPPQQPGEVFKIKVSDLGIYFDTKSEDAPES